MKTKRNKTGLIGFIPILVTLTGCENAGLTARNRISELTGIDVPENAEMVFNGKEKDNFFPVPGRRAQYTIFEFLEMPTEFLTINKITNAPKTSFETQFTQTLESHIEVGMFDLPETYYPNWESEYQWLDTGLRIYFVYFNEAQLLNIFITAT